MQLTGSVRVWLPLPARARIIVILIAAALWLTGLTANAEATVPAARLVPQLHFSQTPAEHLLNRYGAVGTISEDPAGRLWLASRNGLLRYNGMQIERLTSENSALANNLITDLDTQDPAALWLLTYNLQLQNLNYQTQQFRTLDLSASLKTTSFNVARLFGTRDRLWLVGANRLRFIDRQQMSLQETGPVLPALVNRYATVTGSNPTSPDLWVLTDQGQLMRWTEHNQSLQAILQLPVAEPAEAMIAVAGQLYVLQNKKLYQLDPQSQQSTLLLDTRTVAPTAHPFYLIHHQQQLWLSGPDTGLIRYQLTSGKVEHFSAIAGLAHGLSDNHTSALFVDSLQNLWLGTVNSGLQRLSLRHLDAQSMALALPVSNELIPKNPIAVQPTAQPVSYQAGSDALRPLLTFADQSLLLADQHYRLWHWQPGQPDLRPLPASVQAYSARQTADGRLILLGKGGFYLSDASWQQFDWHPIELLQQKTFATITASYLDLQHDLLYMTSYYGVIEVNLTSGVQRIIRPPPLQNQLVTFVNIAARADGKLWLLTRTDGLLLLDPTSDHWQNFNLTGLPGQAFFDLTIDSQQRLWLASDQGAFRLSYINNELTLDSPVLGITPHSSEILAVHLSMDGQVWLNNSEQIMLYQPESWQLHSVQPHQGIQAPLAAKQLVSNQQTLFSGATTGLNLIPLQLAQLQQPAMNRLKLASLQTFKRQLDLTRLGSDNRVALDYDERQFRLQLQGFSSGDISQLRYQLRLPEQQEHWGPPTEQPVFDLVNLPTGQQQLQIRGVLADGTLAGNVLQLVFAIAPPWWRSASAYTAYAVLLLLLSLFIYYDQRGRQRIKAQHLAALAEKEQQLRLALWGSGDELWDWHLPQQRMLRQNCLAPFPDQPQQGPFVLAQQLAQVHPDDRAMVQAAIEQHLAGCSDYYQASYRRLTTSGQYSWVLDRGKITERDAGQCPVRFSGTLQLIDQLKQAEQALTLLNENLEQLVQARTEQLATANQQLLDTINQLTQTQQELLEVEKMASLGAMVAGLAHELNTPLGVAVTSVSSVADLVRQQLELKANQQLTGQFFDQSQQQIQLGCQLAGQNLQRMAQLISVFKKLAVNLSGETVSVVEVAPLWQQVLKQLQPQLQQRNFVVSSDIPAGLSIVTYHSAFSEILQELLRNSLQHAILGQSSQQQGCPAQHPQGEIHLRISLSGELIKLHYQDNGVPISRALRQHMFDPFTTSSRQHGHAGLGLSLIFNLVSQLLHGTVRYQSNDQQGWFDIQFHCRAEIAGQVPAKETLQQLARDQSAAATQPSAEPNHLTKQTF